MDVTTLCYMEKDGKYLMLHRIKKKNDINEGKWIAPGGHCENGESPDDCVKREVMDETGIKLNSVRFRGIVTFYSKAVTGERDKLYDGEPEEAEMPEKPEEAENIEKIEKAEKPEKTEERADITDYMCLFTSDDFEYDNKTKGSELFDCNEGVLEWISKDELSKLDLWKGDLIFLDLIRDPGQPFFSLKLTYEGDVLTEAVLDGKRL